MFSPQRERELQILCLNSWSCWRWCWWNCDVPIRPNSETLSRVLLTPDPPCLWKVYKYISANCISLESVQIYLWVKSQKSHIWGGLIMADTNILLLKCLSLSGWASLHCHHGGCHPRRPSLISPEYLPTTFSSADFILSSNCSIVCLFVSSPG